MIAEGAQPMRDHLFQNPVPDCLVGQARLAPPPAVSLHLFRCCDEAFSYRLDIGFSVVETENQSAAADPAPRQPFCAKVILQHPIVARRLRIADRPYRRDVGELKRQAVVSEPLVQALGPTVPQCILVAGEGACLGRFEIAQELVHRAHDIRVRIEGAARETDVGRTIVPEAFHQRLGATNYADRQTSAQRSPNKRRIFRRARLLHSVAPRVRAGCP